MKTTTIYRINEKDCTIEIAQSVNDNENDIHSAVFNTRTFTFDELVRQHIAFKENTAIFDTFRNRIHSCLRIDRSIEIDTVDMIERFVAEHGENIFFTGFVNAVIEKYDSERILLTKPNDRVKMEFHKKQIQEDISNSINVFFDKQLELICKDTYFNSNSTIEYFTIQPVKTIIAADDYTFNVFHESDNALTLMLSELGQIIHRNKWTICKCGFCGKLFVGTADEVCCKSEDCKAKHEEQKKQIYIEHTEEYRNIKKNYDSYVRNLKKKLTDMKIDKTNPALFDKFNQAKEERMTKMDSLKKKLIRSGLPSDELYELGERYKSEMKGIFERIWEKFSD